MSARFRQVVRFKCMWCGKVFKTDYLHKCKFDPDKRNCLSCVHQIGSDKERGDPMYGEPDIPYFVCDKVDNGTEFCDIDTIARNNWIGKCPDYEAIHGWKGKETFKARRLAAEGGKP